MVVAFMDGVTAAVVRPAPGNGAWCEQEVFCAAEVGTLLRRLARDLKRRGYVESESERLRRPLEEFLQQADAGGPGGVKVRYLVRPDRALVAAEGPEEPPGPAAGILVLGALSRGYDMRWACYRRCGAELVLTEYRILH